MKKKTKWEKKHSLFLIIINNYYTGLGNLVAGLSVHCSRSDVEYQQVKQMQQKMKS